MKLWIQLPAQRPTGKEDPKAYLDIIGKVKRADTEISFQPVPAGPGISSLGGFGYQGIRFFNDRAILQNARRAEGEGFDAVVMSCYFDPALKPARQLMSIPVVGASESSMLMANLMGLRFAVVTSDYRFVDDMMENIRSYGMAERAIAVRPVRAINLDEKAFLGCLGGKFQNLVEDFTQVGRGCIQDGAQVLIAGCGAMSPALTQAGLLQIDRVPVIDPLIAGIKVAEMMVDWKQGGFPAVSRRGFFEDIPAEIYDQASRAGLG